MRYLFLILLLNSYAVAETCDQQFPKPISAMTINEISMFRKCQNEELKGQGLAIDYSRINRSRRDRGESSEERFDRLLSDMRTNDLIEEQNEILREQARQDSVFRDEILSELRD